MLRLKALSFAALGLALTVSCASHSSLRERAVTEAELLRAEVAGKNIQDNDIALADSYLAKAKERESKETAYYADLAAAYYRTALANQSLEASRKVLSDAEEALAVSREQVRKYEMIKAEISAGREQ